MQTQNEQKWDRRYLKMAQHIAGWSKDSTQVGAVVVGKNHTILSQGYNGFPRGIADSPERNQRPTKYDYVVHAEMNVIYNAAFNGISLEGSTLYVSTLPVCAECAKGIIQAGIKKVVVTTMDAPPHWIKEIRRAAELLKEADVMYHKITL